MFELSNYGVTFATRQRARDVLRDLKRMETAEIDFRGVRAASPSFIDELLGGIAERSDKAILANVPEDVEPLVQKIVERRRLKTRFRIATTA